MSNRHTLKYREKREDRDKESEIKIEDREKEEDNEYKEKEEVKNVEMKTVSFCERVIVWSPVKEGEKEERNEQALSDRSTLRGGGGDPPPPSRRMVQEEVEEQPRKDYKKTVAAVGGQTENLETDREEELRRVRDKEARRCLVGVEDRQEQQASDLGRQVNSVVREEEAGKDTRSQAMNASPPLDAPNVDSMIDERSLIFRDVAELQKRNTELLAGGRELRCQHESSLVEKTAELRQEKEMG